MSWLEDSSNGLLWDDCNDCDAWVAVAFVVFSLEGSIVHNEFISCAERDFYAVAGLVA